MKRFLRETSNMLTPVLRWFLGTMILANIGGSMYFALLAVYISTELGASVTEVGLTFTLASIIPLILQILGGWMSDRLGRLRTIAIGAVIASVGYLMMPFVQSWTGAILALMVEYISGSLVGPSFSAFIADQSNEEDRGKVFGLISSIYGVVGIIGPVLAGVLAERMGFRAMFMVAAVFYVIAAVLRIWMVFKFEPRKTNETAERPELLTLQKSLWQLVLLVSSGGILTWIFITDGIRDISFRMAFEFESLYLSEVGGVSLVKIGILTSIFNFARVISTFPAGWLSDKIGERLTILIGFAMQALGLTLFLSSTIYISFMISWIILGLGFGVSSPAYDSLISKVVPEDKRGMAFGLFATSLGIISLPAPAIGGWLWERFSPQTPFVVVVIAVCLSMIPVYFKFRQPADAQSE